ncbi:MAG: glycosyltransferase family 2 protein [Sedimentisphaerales bacterium]|nr:glycosyltransferase family 2 protein [Sedimentisphaerales bacterium]
MDVSIIIVAWNVRQLVYDCLKSVYEYTRDVDFEVIYIDNASEDGSVEMVKEHFADVRIIENSENMGFIRANNQGIEIAGGRYVLLLNSDTILLNNAIAETVRAADAEAQAAVVGCKVLNPDRTIQRTCFMYPSVLNLFLAATYLYKIFPGNRFFGREHLTWWGFDEPREVETICGCFSLVRKEAIDQVGLMDERYFVYGDDPDWCYRFKKNGWKVMFDPAGEIIHYGGQTTSQKARAFRLQLEGSKLIFMKLHRSKAAFPFACLMVALFFFLRVPYWLARGLFKRNEGRKSVSHAVTYLIGSVYALTNWKKLLMNKDVLEGKL